MTRTEIVKDTGPSRYGMLGIYLNDHLAGATAGSELAHRMARSHRGREDGGPLSRLAVEIAKDRWALLNIMDSLDVTVRAYKVGAAWIGEKAGRLKLPTSQTRMSSGPFGPRTSTGSRFPRSRPRPVWRSWSASPPNPART